MEAELHISSVPQPINTTVACGSLNVEDLKCIVKSRNKIKSFQPDIVELSKSLEVESKLLDTFLYKNHNRFRNDKGYRTAKMLDKTLKKMLDLPFMEKLLDFLKFVPSHWGQSSVRLPTLAMSNYCQVLVIIAGKFLQKIDRLARKCGLLNMQRLNLGHFWGVAALCLAIISRVWILCKNLLCKLELSYSYLEKINLLLPGVPLGYDLPQHLYELLDEDLKSFVKNSEAISNCCTDDSSGDLGVNVDEFLDLGEPVKRKPDIDIVNQGVSETKKLKVDNEIPEDKEAAEGRSEKKDCLTDIHSIEEFKKFLSEESDLRKTSKKNSFTRKLSQDQWKALKKEILSNLNPVIPNKSIKLCRKLIRKSIKD